MSIIIKGVMLDTTELPSFSTILKDKNCLINSFKKDWRIKIGNYYPKLVRVENMTCVTLICAVCLMKLVSLNHWKIFSYVATRNKTLSVTLYSTAWQSLMQNIGLLIFPRNYMNIFCIGIFCIICNIFLCVSYWLFNSKYIYIFSHLKYQTLVAFKDFLH